jgi:hypothetical protein
MLLLKIVNDKVQNFMIIDNSWLWEGERGAFTKLFTIILSYKVPVYKKDYNTSV